MHIKFQNIVKLANINRLYYAFCENIKDLNVFLIKATNLILYSLSIFLFYLI